MTSLFLFFCQGLEGDKTMQLAIADPDRYVLKPQLEGGGEMNTVFLVCFFSCDSSSYKHKAQLMTTTSSVGRWGRGLSGIFRTPIYCGQL